ncbi:MAG TPA: SO2930 family diheme c-type cytochrome [Chitinophagales bacterium]|nr:SO2930 family diheme c-type cytochrome [Chitinophagales bacterium]
MKFIFSIRHSFYFLLMIAFSIILLNACKKDLKDDNINQPYVFKEKLSEYKFFTGDLKDLNPVEDVFLYDLSSPLFSDYTIKDRYIQLPEGKSITYKEDGPLEFPSGSVIIKNFSHPTTSGGVKHIETRLLILDPFDNEWKVMVYLWNDAQTEAIKHIIGKTVNIDVQNSQGEWLNTNYKVPNTNDCKGCHISFSKILPIGPKARNLNYIPEFSTENQLDAWAKKGIIKDLPTSGVKTLPVWNDSLNFSLEQRARAYLEINCSHCHRDGSPASYTGYWVDYDQTSNNHLGIFKEPIAAGSKGSGGLKHDIVPGNADSSIVIYRMSNNGVGIAMPELARSIVHTEGVELIRAWINNM